MEASANRVTVTNSKETAFGLLPKIDMLCLSLQSTTHLFDCADLLEAKGDVLSIAGGPAGQDAIFTFAQLPKLDILVLGDGEETIVELLENKESKNLDNIQGLAFKDGEVKINSKRKPPALAGRPFPKIPLALKDQWIRGVNIYIEAHRGCSGTCTFCQSGCSFSRNIRSRPLEEILNETFYFKRHGIQKVAISGGDVSQYGYSSTSPNSDEFVKLLQGISAVVGKENLAGPDVRVDTLSCEVLESIKRYTDEWVFLGLESGSNEMLRRIGKNINVDQTQASVELAKKAQVKVSGSFLVGLVHGTFDHIPGTKELMKRLALEDYTICITEPIPATPYWNLVRDTPLSENPLFMKCDEDRFRVKNMTIAEHEAMVLEEVAHEVVRGREMDARTWKETINSVRVEVERIRRIVRRLVSTSESSL